MWELALAVAEDVALVEDVTWDIEAHVKKRQRHDHLVEGLGWGELSASRGLAAKASHASRRRNMPLQPSESLVGDGLKLCTRQAVVIALASISLRWN